MVASSQAGYIKVMPIVRLNQSPLITSKPNYSMTIKTRIMDEPSIPRPHFKCGCICERLHVECYSSEAALQQVDGAQREATEPSAEEPQVVLEMALQKLEDSSKAGCWFCSILLAGVRTTTENNPSSNIDGTTTIMAIYSSQSPLPFLLNVVSASDNLVDCPAYEFYVPRKFYGLGRRCFNRLPSSAQSRP